MEIGLFFLDIVAVIILVVTSLKNDVKRPGEPLIGPFRYDVTPPVAAGPARPAAGRPGPGQLGPGHSGPGRR